MNIPTWLPPTHSAPSSGLYKVSQFNRVWTQKRSGPFGVAPFIDFPVNRNIHLLLLVRALIIRTILWALWAGLRAVRVLRSLLGTSLRGAVHVLGSGVPSLGKFLGVPVDVRDVLTLDSLLQRAEGRLDG